MRFTARSGTGQALNSLPVETNRTNSAFFAQMGVANLLTSASTIIGGHLLYARARETTIWAVAVTRPNHRHFSDVEGQLRRFELASWGLLARTARAPYPTPSKRQAHSASTSRGQGEQLKPTGPRTSRHPRDPVRSHIITRRGRNRDAGSATERKDSARVKGARRAGVVPTVCRRGRTVGGRRSRRRRNRRERRNRKDQLSASIVAPASPAATTPPPKTRLRPVSVPLVPADPFWPSA
jgi:hypothetical protein